MNRTRYHLLKRTRFTIPLLMRVTRLSRSSIDKHVKKLEDGGYIRRIPDIYPVEYYTTEAGATVHTLINKIQNGYRNKNKQAPTF